MKTISAEAGFESGTIVWVTRNGVTFKCYGPSCTWQDDPNISQTLILPGNVPAGHGWYDAQTGEEGNVPKGAKSLSVPDFRKVVETLGGSYVRKDNKVYR